MSNKRPDLYGLITIPTGTQRTRIGEIAFWKQFPKTAKQPCYTGKVKINGEQYQVALWSNQQ
jgi:hypothetical protein